MVQFDDTFSTNRMAELHRAEEERLIAALAPQYGYDYVDLKTTAINPEALQVVSETAAREAMAAPFALTRKTLSMAIRNPNEPQTQEFLDMLGKRFELRIFMCSTASLEFAWERYGDRQQTQAQKKGVLDINPDDIERTQTKITTPNDVVKLIKGVRASNHAKRISETLEVIFAGAFALGASDVHIEPESDGIRMRYRLDGVLTDIIDLEREIYTQLLSRLKLLSGMILNQRDEAQDGRFTLNFTHTQVEIRSSVIPGASGESIVMRLLDPSVASFDFATLGLSRRLYEVMQEELRRPNGLILTTGPTGSGKTTALYAFLREVHTPEQKIITIENPVEYKLDDIVQTQTSEDYSFATGLRAILRQDPDIIMVGEIRDKDVAATAIHAAQTGHLVFSTLHTNSAVGAFPRLVDLKADPGLLGSSINVVIGQRLVRQLCEKCKKQKTPTAEETQLIQNLLSTHPDAPALPDPLVLYTPGGCPACNHTGFTGRVGVFEAIVMDEAVEAAVIRDPREHVILDAATPQKIPNMAEHGIEKVIAGTTSLEELRRVVDLSSSEPKHTPAPPATTADETFAEHIV